MGKVISFDRNPFNLRKKIGEVGVIVSEFFAQIIREVDLDLVPGLMYHFDDYTLDLCHQDAFFVIHELQT